MVKMNCNRLFYLAQYIQHIIHPTCNNIKIINEIFLHSFFTPSLWNLVCTLRTCQFKASATTRAGAYYTAQCGSRERRGLDAVAGSLLVAKRGREFQMLEPICGTPWGCGVSSKKYEGEPVKTETSGFREAIHGLSCFGHSAILPMSTEPPSRHRIECDSL